VRHTFALVIVMLMLAACGRSASQNESAVATTTSPTPTAPRELCVNSVCGSKLALATVPDAENILFTPEGRLFVTGGTNVFEITDAGGGTFVATPLFGGSCNFSGLAQRGNTLYAACFDGNLYAATINASPVVNFLYNLNMNAPNGMAVDGAGRLYIVNGPVSSSSPPPPDPRIVRLVFDPSDPFTVLSQEDWLASGLEFPNGLAFRAPQPEDANQGVLFLTDSSATSATLGIVRRVDIALSGQAENLISLLTFTTILDDLSLVDDQLLVSSFSGGQIHLMTQTGTLLQSTDANSFETASSVQVGQAPLFTDSDILVTEKGTIGETSSNTGNRLSVFRAN